jgi:hypothetical protein
MTTCESYWRKTGYVKAQLCTKHYLEEYNAKHK